VTIPLPGNARWFAVRGSVPNRRLTFHYSDSGNVARELRVMQIMHDDWHMCKSKALHRSGKVSEDFFSRHFGEERQC
jgi:hypothetical protein